MTVVVSEDEVVVQLYQAKLVTVHGQVRLSKAVARQFPVIRPFSFRFDQMVTAIQSGGLPDTPEEVLPPAYLKVNAATIEKDATGWYLLVDHPDGGLAWAYPVHPESYVAGKGWPYDKLEDIPTVIL